MVAPQVFKVLTDFRFETGSAILSSGRLSNAVEGISTAATNAQFQLQRITFGLGAQFGLGGSSILGLISKSITSAEVLRNTQLDFSNLISANRDNLVGTIDTFNDRLRTSGSIIRNISQQARTFALDERALADLTKLTAPLLISKGASGVNFDVPIEISRNLLKSAPNLGIQPGLVQGQLLRIIEGQASIGDTLFRRLVGETTAFAPFRKGGSKGFNALDSAKRIEILRKGLGQFAADVDVLAARTGSMTGQIRILSQNITGFTGILIPFGKVLQIPILKALKGLNAIVENQGRRILKSASLFIGPALEKPIQTLISLGQLSELSRDVSKGSGLFALVGGINLLGLALKFLGVTAFFLHPAIGALILTFGLLFDITQRMSPLLKTLNQIFLGFMGGFAVLLGFMVLFKSVMIPLAFLFKFAGFVISKILIPLGLMVGLFQVISRAVAIANINDARAAPELLAKFADQMVRFKFAAAQILSPLARVGDALANFIAPIFSKTALIEAAIGPFDKLINLMGLLGEISITAQAGFQGLVFVILNFFETLIEVMDNVKKRGVLGIAQDVAIGDPGVFDPLAKLGNIGDVFNAGIDTFLRDNLAKIGTGDDEGFVSQTNTNIGTININNNFKEQLEPDRIAFTLRDQLTRAASNPTQARGKGFANIGNKPVSAF